MFIATPPGMISAPAESNVAAAAHRAPLERGPRGRDVAINMWPRRGQHTNIPLLTALNFADTDPINLSLSE